MHKEDKGERDQEDVCQSLQNGPLQRLIQERSRQGCLQRRRGTKNQEYRKKNSFASVD